MCYDRSRVMPSSRAPVSSDASDNPASRWSREADWSRVKPESDTRRQVRLGVRAGSSNPAHAHVFDLEILVDAVMRPLAADAAFLDAAEWRDLGRDEAGVDADDAAFERLG